MRLFSLFLVVLFTYFAVIQYNDPDAARWIAIYLSAAALAALTTASRPVSGLLIVVASIAFAWALLIFTGVVGKSPFIGTEEKREFVDLLFVSCAMLALYLHARRAAYRSTQKATDAA